MERALAAFDGGQCMTAAKCPRCGAETAGHLCSCGGELRLPVEGKSVDLAEASKPTPALPANACDEPDGQLLDARANTGGQGPPSDSRPGEGLAAKVPTAFPAVDAISKILSVAMLLGAVGFAVGNWHPVWGDFLTKTMAAPLSPARLQLGYEHAVAGAVLGLILGTIGARRR